MSLGDRWDNTTIGSPAKLNTVTVISGTGDYLDGLTKTEHVLYKCTETGSGYIIDHVYQTGTDGESIYDLSAIGDHTHTASAGTGGSLLDIFRANSLLMDSGGMFSFNNRASLWLDGATGTGSVTDDTDGTTGEQSVLLSTGGTSGGRGQITCPGLKQDFSKRSMFQAKLRIGTLSSLALTCGVRVDSVTAVDSNGSQYGVQVCTATNNNWFIRSADGDSHSASDSTIAATTSRVAIKIEHFPDLGTPRLDLYIDASSAFQKTSDVASTNAGFNGNVIRHGIKNTTGADRTLYVYDCRVRFYVSDNWI